MLVRPGLRRLGLLLLLATACSSSEAVVDGTRRAGYPAVVATQDHLYAAYVLSNLDQVMIDFFGEKVASSTDGETWTAPTVISATDAPPQPLSCAAPFLVADDGSLLLGLMHMTGYVMRSADAGATWTPISVPLLYATITGMATSGTHLYVMLQLGLDTVIQPYDLGTQTWGADIHLPQGFVNGACPSLWASGTDLVVVGAGGTGAVVHSANQGVAWDPVQSGLGGSNVSRLVSTGSSVFFASMSPPVLYGSTNHGQTFTNVGALPDNGNAVQLAVAGDELYVAYETDPDEVIWVASSSNGGVSWGAAQHVVTNAATWDVAAGTIGGKRIVTVVHGMSGIHATASDDDGVTWR